LKKGWVEVPDPKVALKKAAPGAQSLAE
jgi:hypothetical protein